MAEYVQRITRSAEECLMPPNTNLHCFPLANSGSSAQSNLSHRFPVIPVDLFSDSYISGATRLPSQRA